MKIDSTLRRRRSINWVIPKIVFHLLGNCTSACRCLLESNGACHFGYYHVDDVLGQISEEIAFRKIGFLHRLSSSLISGLSIWFYSQPTIRLSGLLINGGRSIFWSVVIFWPTKIYWTVTTCWLMICVVDKDLTNVATGWQRNKSGQQFIVEQQLRILVWQDNNTAIQFDRQKLDIWPTNGQHW